MFERRYLSHVSPRLLTSIALRSARSIGVLRGLATVSAILLKRGLLELRLPGYRAPILARSGSSDVEVFEKVFVKEEYHCQVDSPRLIVDLGANVGYASLYFAAHYPGATIVAVEPEASNYELLAANARAYPQIVPLQAAVWGRSARLSIANPGDPNWMFRVTEAAAAGAPSVAAITIPEILARYGDQMIDILKVDIESAELELFGEGCEQWLGRVRTIIIELHDNVRPGCSQSFYRAIGRLPFTQYIRGENIVVLLGAAAAA